jgi:hypothetical protein
MLGTAIMAFGVWLASEPMRSGNPLIPGGRPIELIAVIGFGVLIYSLIARWLHGGEFKNMLAFLRIRRYKSSSGVDER